MRRPNRRDADATGRSLIAATGGTRAARTAGSNDARTVTPTPTLTDTTTVRGSSTVVVSGRPSPSARMRSSSPAPEHDAGHESERRRERPHHQRLEHDRPHDLPAARAHRAQQPELTRALRDEDGEGVEDDERADDHADRGEAEQRVGEEAEELPHGAAGADRRLRGGEHLEPGTERAGQALLQHDDRLPGRGLHVHRVDRPAGVERGLRGRKVERRRGDRAEIGPITHPEQPHDAELLGRALEQHAHRVADPVALLLRGARVHEDLTRTARRAAVGAHEPQRTPARPGEPQGGWPPAADGLAVTAHELGVALHEGNRPGDAGDGGDGGR